MRIFFSFIILVVSLLNPLLSFSQADPGSKAKKPKLMVIPSDFWCKSNGYGREISEPGRSEWACDYVRAFQENGALISFVGSINDFFARKGYPLVELETTLKNIQDQIANEAAITSNSSGSSVMESQLEIINQTAKPDLIIRIGWEEVDRGNNNYRNIKLTVAGVDAWTGKSFASPSFKSERTNSADISTILERMFTMQEDIMNDFAEELQKYFLDIQNNGREIQVVISVFQGSSINLESEYDGKELSEVIDDWMYLNSVNHSPTTTFSSGNKVVYDQVRISLYTPTGKPQDPKAYVTQLKKYLNAPPYNITCKVVYTKNVPYLIIGEK